MIVQGFCFRIERLTLEGTAEPVVELTSQQLQEVFEADGRPHMGWDIPGPRDYPAHRVSFVPGRVPMLPTGKRHMNAALVAHAVLCAAAFLAGLWIGA